MFQCSEEQKNWTVSAGITEDGELLEIYAHNSCDSENLLYIARITQDALLSGSVFDFLPYFFQRFPTVLTAKHLFLLFFLKKIIAFNNIAFRLLLYYLIFYFI